MVDSQRAQRRVGAMVRDKYRIDAFIASGSMSNVYAATHRNGSRVALKILHKDLARDTQFGERFRREGYFGNAVVHPGIVRAIDDDVTDDGCAFLVFELLEGETLEHKRERLGGRLSLQETLTIGDAVLDILGAAHDHQILHRDLKPDNVFLTRKGDVKLMDFGTARFNDGKSKSELTATGMVLGTPAFMPPEQAHGKRDEVDPRSDIWAVGAMLFVCLTGQGVHAGGDPKTKLIAVARTPARSLKDVAPEIPRVVASVIDRALAFDKAERWADAKSMRESLGWARRSLTGSDPGSEPETRRQADLREDVPRDSRGQRPISDEEEPTTLGRAREMAASGNLIEPPPPSRRTDRDQPAPSSRRPMPTPPSPFDDEAEETEKRTQIAPKVFAGLLGKEPQIKRMPLSEGVITSAPPVTQREMPPSMPMSEGPAFSLKIQKGSQKPGKLDEPIPSSSMRETPQKVEAVPQTSRLPGQSAPVAVQAGPIIEADTGKIPPQPDAAALMRAALAQQGLGNDEPAPLTAASPFGPTAALPNQFANQFAGTAPLPNNSPFQPLISDEAPIAPFASAPPPAYHPPTFGSVPPLGHSAPPSPLVADPIAGASFRPMEGSGFIPTSGTLSRPRGGAQAGQLVREVTERKSSPFRFLIPLLVGILAAGGTYQLILRQKAKAARAATPAATTSAAAPTPIADAGVVDASTADAGGSSLAGVVTPAPSASASASSSAVAAAASSAPPRRKKPRPKPPPTAPTADQPAPPPAPTENPAILE